MTITTGNKGERVAIVIPARNEATTVGRVVADAREHWSCVFVVDDGSCDETAKVALASGAEVVRHQSSLGYGAALRSGLLEAVRHGVEIVVFLDGDGAHDPHESPRLIEEHRRARADMTIGTRFHPGLSSWFPTAKRDANLLGRAIFNAVHGTDISDVASGYRILGPNLIQHCIKDASFGAAFEILAQAIASRLTIHEAPISVRYSSAEPFCTGSGELLNFLDACTMRAVGSLRADLLAVRLAIAGAESCEIAIDLERFHLHYIRDFEAYLVQRQNPWFGASSEFQTITLTRP